MSHSRVALGLAGLLLAGVAQAQTGNPGGPINDNLGAPDYGVCRGLDPKCFHDWKRPAATRYRILLFTRTGGPRHENLGPALASGLNPPLTEANVVQNGMLALAARNGWTLDYTEDLRFMTQLGGYNAVVFFSSSRDALDDDGKTALRQYMRAGGGFVGVHNAFGAHYQWPWYEGLLGGTNFYDHGPHRTGDVVVLDRKDASTKGLPPRFAFKDEWYNLVPFPTRVRFLATVDETSWAAVPPAAPLSRQRQSASPAGRAATAGGGQPSGARRFSPGGLVPILRRGEGLAHDAGP